jgi:hypothetical protein
MKVTKKAAQIQRPERHVMDSDGSAGGVSVEEGGLGWDEGRGELRSRAAEGSIVDVAALGCGTGVDI